MTVISPLQTLPRKTNQCMLYGPYERKVASSKSFLENTGFMRSPRICGWWYLMVILFRLLCVPVSKFLDIYVEKFFLWQLIYKPHVLNRTMNGNNVCCNLLCECIIYNPISFKFNSLIPCSTFEKYVNMLHMNTIGHNFVIIFSNF